MSFLDPKMPDGINLSELRSPADIKSMDIDQLQALAAQLRAVLVRRLAATGGHVGPNLGIVEATVALHYVFDFPKDKLIFDVSHQCYTHKMLTGRIRAYLDPAHYGDVSGYTSPSESEYDLFAVGHTSTSVALAAGMAKARDLKGGSENVVAVIGDGSLSGGEAFEGLDAAADLGSNFIVVVNDNQMSIAENHGGIYRNLDELRRTNGTAECNLFRAIGMDYIYVGYGNDMRSLVEAFRAVKGSKKPVVVHLNTMKGEGLPVAERDKESFHYSAPFDPRNGELLHPGDGDNYINLFGRWMCDLMGDNRDIVALTAGTPGAIGFPPSRRQMLGDRFVDVGIAEQCGVAMSAGLTKAGMRPVFALQASFVQRAYDQLEQEVAINNLPATFVIFNASVWGIPDETHLGFFATPMFCTIPRFRVLAPASLEEFFAMTRWAIEHPEHPTTVIAPCGPVVHAQEEVETDYAEVGYRVVEQGDTVAVIAAGDFLGIGRQATALMRAKGLNPTLISPRIVSDVDPAAMEALKGYKTVITLEDNSIAGGMGEKIAASLGRYGLTIHTLGLPKAIPNRFKAAALLEQQGITPQAIADLV